MFLFLLFTLSVREDKPLKKWLEWLPENKVKSMILDRQTFAGQVLPKAIIYSNSALIQLNNLGLSEMEVRYSLSDAEVCFSHVKTKARSTPKEYYLISSINRKEYYFLIAVHSQYSMIIELGEFKD